METEKEEAENTVKALFLIEWEERALQEVISNFKTVWRTKPELYKKLSEENKSIGRGSLRLRLASNNEELNDLYERIFSQLIFREPYLYRMFAYITREPEDRQAGRSFFEKYIGLGRIVAYNDFLDTDVLEKSKLADHYKISGMPLHSFFVGQVLSYLFKEAENRRNADFALSQYIKLIWEEKGPILEYSTKEAYNSPLNSQIIDDVLYEAVNNAQKDKRQAIFFGKDFKPDHKVIKRYGSEEQDIPFQLLPRYQALIKKRAKQLPKVETTVVEDDGKIRIKMERDLTAVEMLFLEAVLDQNPQRAKPLKMPFVAFMEKQLIWRSGKEWDDKSTEALAEERFYELRKQHAQSDEKDVQDMFKKEKRISKAKMEKSGGSLDEFLDPENEDAGRRMDFLEDDDNYGPETEMTLKEDFTLQEAILEEARNDTRLMGILANDKGRTPKDQKYFERKIKEIKKKFNLIS